MKTIFLSDLDQNTSHYLKAKIMLDAGLRAVVWHRGEKVAVIL